MQTLFIDEIDSNNTVVHLPLLMMGMCSSSTHPLFACIGNKAKGQNYAAD